MDERIRPKSKRPLNVVYGDVQDAEKVGIYDDMQLGLGGISDTDFNALPDKEEQKEKCDPEDQKPITD